MNARAGFNLVASFQNDNQRNGEVQNLRRSEELLGRANVDGLKTLLSLLNFELNRLTLFESAISIDLDRAVVHEDVGTVLLRDESITLFRVKPLHRSGRHRGDPLFSLTSYS